MAGPRCPAHEFTHIVNDVHTRAPTSILIADDQAMVRGGFRALLDAEPGFTVVGEASDGDQALELVRQYRPDIVLMDIRMPGLDGLQATRLITAEPTLASTRVLVLTTFDLDEYIFAALRAGASGFLLKGMEPSELINAVRVIARGDMLLAPVATRLLIETYVKDAAPAPSEYSVVLSKDVTERESEILALLAKGLSNVEIADRLVISPFTVKSHISSLLTKHALRDRVQLVVLAYETGLVHR
jgi:DNA-binding NarL/FixJ family response regulator